ncbi:MAG: hypothetical protein FWC27_01640 [Firmicutes bacterium]|nr:hypothetical protein [Bacillota bacterium]
MHDFLKAAAPEALLNFLEEYARHDPRLDNALRVQFAQPDFDAELDKISGIIDTVLADVPDWDKHDKWGCISIDTGDMLFEVEQRVKQGRFKLAFAILEALYRKLLENFEYQGECELAMEAEDCLRRMSGVAVQAVDPADQEYIIEHCIALARSKVGEGYGANYGDRLMLIAALLEGKSRQGSPCPLCVI